MWHYWWRMNDPRMINIPRYPVKKISVKIIDVRKKVIADDFASNQFACKMINIVIIHVINIQE